MVGISCYGKQLVAYEKITEENTKADPAVMNESDEKSRESTYWLLQFWFLCTCLVYSERLILAA